MYTWGDGSGGKLGNGNQQDVDSPQRLHTLWGQPVRHIAVSGIILVAIESVMPGPGIHKSCVQHIALAKGISSPGGSLNSTNIFMRALY